MCDNSSSIFHFSKRRASVLVSKHLRSNASSPRWCYSTELYSNQETPRRSSQGGWGRIHQIGCLVPQGGKTSPTFTLVVVKRFQELNRITPTQGKVKLPRKKRRRQLRIELKATKEKVAEKKDDKKVERTDPESAARSLREIITVNRQWKFIVLVIKPIQLYFLTFYWLFFRMTLMPTNRFIFPLFYR